MAVRTRRPGAAGTVGLDLRRLHAGWMGLAFPPRRVAVGRVHGHRVPETAGGRIAYDGWVGLGALAVALLYPLVLVGLVLRGPLRRIDRAASDSSAVPRLAGRTALLVPASVIALLLATSLDGAVATGLGVGIAALTGWLLDGAVTLADLVRPGRRGRI